MRTVWPMSLVILVACSLLSCSKQIAGEEYMREKIPIQIQAGKTVTVSLTLSGNGPNDVGIRCTPELWGALFNDKKPMEVRVRSSDYQGTRIYGVNPGGTPAGLLYVIPHVYYLFEITGDINSNATLDIIFPNAPQNAANAEIIVSKTPADCGP